MGFKVGKYYLHSTIGVRGTKIFFFSKGEMWKGQKSINLPAGYRLGGRNKRTGLPFLKKK